MSIRHITLIGSGNVATALGKAFRHAGLQIDAVYSRSPDHAATLARELETFATDRLDKLPRDSDLYLLAVKDEAIADVSAALETKGMVVHTSGSTPMKVLDRHQAYGVLYGLQTFSRQVSISLADVPFLVEASSGKAESELLALASSLSKITLAASTVQRQALHVAAVFANNFTNHLLTLSQRLLDEQHLDFGLLEPLIRQTISNALDKSPAEVQTGPALRRDNLTIERHLRALKDHPGLEKIYRVITESIQQFHPKS